MLAHLGGFLFMDNSMKTRKCYKCKEIKELSEFYKDCTDKLGYAKACKICSRKLTDDYQKNHPDYFKLKGKEHYKKEDNPKKYQKYRLKYLDYVDNCLRSVRGRLSSTLDAARTRAVKKTYEYNLTLDWLVNMYEKQDGKCILTGMPFVLDRNEDGNRYQRPYAPSIDRIDPSKGYTKDNVRLVCVIVNLALNRFGEDVFSNMCHSYVKNKRRII